MLILPVEYASPAYDEIVALRDTLLRKPLGLQFKVNEMDKEYLQIHFAAYTYDWELRGCLVLKPLGEEVIKMRQVAVAEAHQGQGIGQALVVASEEWARARGYREMELNARDVAVVFYEKLGYVKQGEPFEEVSIKHFKMVKEL